MFHVLLLDAITAYIGRKRSHCCTKDKTDGGVLCSIGLAMVLCSGGQGKQVQNLQNFVGQHIETHGTTFIFGSTSNSLSISSYNFWNKFKFESSLNFKGVQTFFGKI
jgi:hypothetical protein